jgi:6-phosphogluconolactonase
VTKGSTAIQVFPDLEALSHSTAAIFTNLSKSCTASGGRFAVAVSGGSTPRRLYTILSSEQYRNSVDWSRVHFFWVDERCVPKENEESNFKTIFDTLLSRIPLPTENIHRIRGEEVPEKAAIDYEEDIRRFFGKSKLVVFDLIILGMGKDGHQVSQRQI